MPEAIVFDIQRSSFVDGPGVRTAVFLKGCGLRCQWCHNPESWEKQPQLLFFANRCTGCGSCKTVCPVDAILPNGQADPKKCLVCGKCGDICPSHARRVCGKAMTVEEVVQKAAADKPFYDATGGGVTFSGGECLLQPTFVLACVERLRAMGIASAIDTAGDVERSVLTPFIEAAGLFLYDMKCLEGEKHRHFTGRDNGRILDNLAYLLETCPEKVEIRIPVIPGCNADPAELSAMADWLAEHPAPRQVTLLPYHAMGVVKAAASGHTVLAAEVPSAEEMESYRNIFKEKLHGITVS